MTGQLFNVCLSFFLLSCSQQIKVKVIEVYDGDTIKAVDSSNNKQYVVRLADIDCPEKDQVYGQTVKKFVTDECLYKYVSITITGTDTYNRSIGTVYLDSININSQLLENGFAWYYKKFSNNSGYELLYNNAKRKHIGLWALDHPQAPYLFRKETKNYSF